jgi:tetratricopeptide (TPR) repeat protein
MYCGKDIRVQQAISAAGPPVDHLIQLAQAAEASGNHEEAYEYWTRALEVDPTNASAWIGKAISAGWQSNLIQDRLSEMTAGIDQALNYSDKEREGLAEEASHRIVEVVQAYYGLSIDHTMEFITVDTSWPEHIERSLSMLEAMSKAIELAPGDLHVKTETLAIVEALLKGIEYPKGEFSEGFEYLNVPPDLRPRLESSRIDLVAKIKVQDPTYVPKDVKPVKGPGCGCQLVVLLVALVIAAVVLHFLIKFSKGDF